MFNKKKVKDIYKKKKKEGVKDIYEIKKKKKMKTKKKNR